jgi:hypothetical protein
MSVTSRFAKNPDFTLEQIRAKTAEDALAARVDALETRLNVSGETHAAEVSQARTAEAALAENIGKEAVRTGSQLKASELRVEILESAVPELEARALALIHWMDGQAVAAEDAITTDLTAWKYQIVEWDSPKHWLRRNWLTVASIIAVNAVITEVLLRFWR